MSDKTIYCKKHEKNLPQLSKKPFPGELGDKIYREISAQAWDNWLGEQTKLINEYRLNPLDNKAQSFLEKSMLDFLYNKK